MLFICSYSLSLSIKRSCTFSQDSPLRNTQLIEHLNQAFLQLYAVEQPLQLQEIILSQVSGADSLVVVIGVSPILFRVIVKKDIQRHVAAEKLDISVQLSLNHYYL